jgi:ADP-ribose pyrophosphatase YjhB (NUDIX family)
MKLVCVKLSNSKEKVMLHHYLNAKEWWYPAGRVERNETYKEAAARELLSRTGYSVNPHDLKANGKIEYKEHKYNLFSANLSKAKKVGLPQTEIKFGIL